MNDRIDAFLYSVLPYPNHGSTQAIDSEPFVMSDWQKTIYKAVVNRSYDPFHLNTRGYTQRPAYLEHYYGLTYTPTKRNLSVLFTYSARRIQSFFIESRVFRTVESRISWAHVICSYATLQPKGSIPALTWDDGRRISPRSLHLELTGQIGRRLQHRYQRGERRYPNYRTYARSSGTKKKR